MKYKVAIPDCYKWMAASNKKLYVEYVKGYVKSSHPGLKPVRIERDYVICVKKG